MTRASTGILVLLAAIAMECAAQLCLKLGADRALHRRPEEPERPVAALPDLPRRAWLLLGVSAYGVEVLLYTEALRFLDVSVAFPLGSLCFVGVALLSRVFLGEAVGRIRWLGVGCIVAGAVLVAA